MGTNFTSSDWQSVRNRDTHIKMKPAIPLFIVPLALSILFLAGGATGHAAQTENVQSTASILTSTNVNPGATYDIRVYIVDAGDSLPRIAHKFRISVGQLKALNPEIEATRLKIGQKLVVFEKP